MPSPTKIYEDQIDMALSIEAHSILLEMQLLDTHNLKQKVNNTGQATTKSLPTM